MVWIQWSLSLHIQCWMLVVVFSGVADPVLAVGCCVGCGSGVLAVVGCVFVRRW